MGSSNRLFCETGSFSCLLNPQSFLEPEVLKLSFPPLESWVVWSLSLSTGIWDCQVHQLPPCCTSFPLQLLNSTLFTSLDEYVSSLAPWLLDFHAFLFSGSSDCFLFLNLLLSVFGCARKKNLSIYAFILVRR